MATGDSSDRMMKEIRRRVDRIGLRDLDACRLRAMVEELDQEKQTLLALAADQESSLIATFKNGKCSDIGDHKKRIRQLLRQFDDVDIERQRVWNAYQRQSLEERVAQALGSAVRAHLVESGIVVLIFLVIGLLVYSVIDSTLPARTLYAFFLVDTACCAVFIIDFFFRLRLADSKLWYWRRHWVDLITSIPIPDAQILRLGRFARVFRLARLARLARLLRVLRLVFFFWRGMDKLEDVFHMRLMKRSLLCGTVILVMGAALIYWAEVTSLKQPVVLSTINQSESADVSGISTFGNSIWWSFTTVVTGGFADIHNPTTFTGRLLTVLLVLSGMIVVGIFTATLTSVLIGDESEDIELMQKSISHRLDHIEAQISELSDARESLPSRRD